MEARQFQALLGQLASLSDRQRATLQRVLSERPVGEAVRELLESKHADQRQCPHCGSKHVVAWGYAHGLHRHRCRDCRRTFNALTGTALARLRHKEHWLTFGAALQDAVSVRKWPAAAASPPARRSLAASLPARGQGRQASQTRWHRRS